MKTCPACGSPFDSVRNRCGTCTHLIGQASTSSVRLPIPAQVAEKAIRDAAPTPLPNAPNFRCQYTGIPIVTGSADNSSEENTKKSKWGDYASFDHVDPQSNAQAKITCRLINDVKLHLSESDFYRLMVSLAVIFEQKAVMVRANIDEARAIILEVARRTQY